MIRPKTPRRGAERTMNILKQAYDIYKDNLIIEIFGCSDDEKLLRDYKDTFKFTNHGEVSRVEVAQILQKSDCFIDLSDYQAFGRTGLEAMACGTFPILTKFGGVYEYAIDNVNSYIVDPFNSVDVLNAIIKFIENFGKMNFDTNLLSTAAKYSIHRAAVSELCALDI